MIPARFAPAVFGLIVSGLMSFIVSGIATLRAVGMAPDYPTQWMGAWVVSWSAAFPTILIVAPIARKLVTKLTRKD